MWRQPPEVRRDAKVAVGCALAFVLFALVAQGFGALFGLSLVLLAALLVVRRVVERQRIELLPDEIVVSNGRSQRRLPRQGAQLRWVWIGDQRRLFSDITWSLVIEGAGGERVEVPMPGARSVDRRTTRYNELADRLGELLGVAIVRDHPGQLRGAE